MPTLARTDGIDSVDSLRSYLESITAVRSRRRRAAVIATDRDVLGVTRERVRPIEKKALAKLRDEPRLIA